MNGDTDQREETNETLAKPTITIAEREAAREAQTTEAQPTITIAEKEGDE